MTKQGPERIGKILEKVWGKMERKREENSEISQILGNINSALGKNISKYVKPQKLYRKRLTLLVNAPTHLQELLFKKEGIIEAVNNALGREAIREINVRVGQSR